jgi:hypothetical protein
MIEWVGLSCKLGICGENSKLLLQLAIFQDSGFDHRGIPNPDLHGDVFRLSSTPPLAAHLSMKGTAHHVTE